MDYSFITRFAVTYDCNAYGASTYNNNEACATTATNPGTTTNGTASTGLAPTGTDIAIAIGCGLALIVIGAIIILKMRRKPAQKS